MAYDLNDSIHVNGQWNICSVLEFMATVHCIIIVYTTFYGCYDAYHTCNSDDYEII